MNYRVVIINGAARSGKDTFINRFQSYFDGVVFSLSTVTDVKLAAQALGIYEADGKTDAKRKLWSDIKDAWTAYNDGPFASIVQKIGGWTFGRGYSTDNMVFFVHVREPSEIEKFKKHYGACCSTLLIERPGMPCPDNHADQDVKNCSYDFRILNNGGLRDLENQARFIAQVFSKNLAKNNQPMKGTAHA